MQTATYSIFQFSIIVVLLTAAFIFVFFRLFRFLMQFIRLPIQKSQFLEKNLPAVELLVWIFYLMWSIQFLFSRGYLITLIPLIIFVILILYLSWYALKDITAGIIFKTACKYQLNDHVTVAGITGKITRMGFRNLELEDYGGQTVTIPYSRIVGSIMLRAYPSQSLLSHNFKLQVKTGSSDDVFQITNDLRSYILTLPWSSQKKEPKISIEKELQEQVIYNITIFSLDQSYFKKTEKLLEKEYQAKVI